MTIAQVASVTYAPHSRAIGRRTLSVELLETRNPDTGSKACWVDIRDEAGSLVASRSFSTEMEARAWSRAIWQDVFAGL